MLSVELKHLADTLDSVGQLSNVSQQAKDWSTRIHDAIWETTVSSHKKRLNCLSMSNNQVVNNIFAYETNGKQILFQTISTWFTMWGRFWWSICHGRCKCAGKLHPTTFGLLNLNGAASHCCPSPTSVSSIRPTLRIWLPANLFSPQGILTSPQAKFSAEQGISSLFLICLLI